MPSELDPIATASHLSETYRRYLKTVFPLRDQTLRKQYWRALDEPGTVTKGPLLEAQPPFLHGRSVEQLVEAGILDSEFRALSGSSLPITRPLYRHQELAIDKLVSLGRNIVVSTGTGSGKTETFLLPIMDHLLRERREGTLAKPGVRALLLYPMNALANDQLKRLRGLLRDFPSITFGRYTGETLETRTKALEVFRAQSPGETVPHNELLSREEMRDSPPHILLTNYAMLEYLLLRPRDSEFFDGATGDHWKFIVLDEAHIYTGATGIEMAMLLRRLKDRVTHGDENRLTCIATSATIGRGRPDFPEVAGFATELFGEPFEYVSDDPDRQDVVQAEREAVDAPLVSGTHRPCNAYVDAKAAIEAAAEGTAPDLPAILSLRASGLPVENRYTNLSLNQRLHALLEDDQRVAALRHLLANGPLDLGHAAERVCGDSDDPVVALTSLVSLAVRAKPREESLSLLPARYHFFARALEGTYVCLDQHSSSDEPGRKLFLARHEECPVCAQEGRKRRVFELAVCTQCGSEYILGRTEDTEKGMRLASLKAGSFEVPEYFLIGDQYVDDDAAEDEAALSDETAPETEERLTVCIACGLIQDESSRPGCNCGSAAAVRMVKATLKQNQTELKKCLSCGIRANREIVSRFLTGQDAPVGVLSAALYESLPSPQVAGAKGASADGRKLLVFADSRQDAAFFAPYLRRSYERLLRRRLLIQALEDPEARFGDLRIRDLSEFLLPEATSAGQFTPDQSRREREIELQRGLMLEFTSWDRRNTPEGVGLVAFRPVRPDTWTSPSPLAGAPWNLSDAEGLELIERLLDTLRHDMVVTFPTGVSPEDEEFAPRARAAFVRGYGSDSKADILSWEPMLRENKRSELLERILAKRAPQLSPEERAVAARGLLKGLWNHLTNPTSPWSPYFQIEQLGAAGAVHRLDFAMWEVVPGYHESLDWQRCSTCGAITRHSLLGVCPTRGCDGELEHFESSDPIIQQNHYRRLYESLRPIALTAEEHTAQWTSGEAARIQDSFIRGEVNVLSCSTTFELGVDVGELQAVLMRNVPPTTANYVQRAGRAGRRTDSAAFVVTFAQRRSHDFTHFKDPRRIVAGKVPPPVIALGNEKIVRRHIHSVALAGFFRWALSEYGLPFPGKVGPFFAPDDGETGPALLERFLAMRPKSISDAIQRIAPEELHEPLGLSDWTWSSQLLGGGLAKAQDEVDTDVHLFEERIQQASQDQDFRTADRFNRIRKTVLDRDLLGFLASRNVLPKYGFPVDVVELQTKYAPTAEGKRLELSRDLRVALSEYAPGSELVAGGHVWIGGGLGMRAIRDPAGTSKAWDQWGYAVCQNCLRFNQDHLADEPPTSCRQCGSSLKHGFQGLRGVYVKPEFGFVASPDEPKKPGDGRPKRLYSSRVFFADFSKAENDEMLDANREPNELYTAVFARGGQLAVVNAGALGTGFRVCERCGYGAPSPLSHRGSRRARQSGHKDPRTGRKCGGTLRPLHLGHTFETDVLAIGMHDPSAVDMDARRSLLYALLEGASVALGISRSDMDGVVFGQSPLPQVIIYDNVPGGAGHAKRIGERFPEVVETSLARILDCECGRETSCYECLRNYSNQPYHDSLRRDLAIDLLTKLMGASA